MRDLRERRPHNHSENIFEISERVREKEISEREREGEISERICQRSQRVRKREREREGEREREKLSDRG